MRRQTLFYDPYLEVGGALYPLPVLVTNYRDSEDEKVNEDTDQAKWQFTRRFFLVENTLLPGANLRMYMRYLNLVSVLTCCAVIRSRLTFKELLKPTN